MNRIRQLLLSLCLLSLATWPAFAQEATVKISLAEFLKLTTQSLAGGTADRSPIPFMFSQGDYRLSDEGDWCRVEAAVSVRVYETGWVEVPLLPAGVLVESASLDGKPLTLYGKNGQHTFALKSAGLHALKLSYYLKLNSHNATKSVTFQSPSTSVTNVRVVLKGEDLKVSSSPSIPLSNRGESGRTVVEGTIPAGAGSVSLSWIPLRATARLHGKGKQEKAKLYGRLYCLVTPGEREVRSRVRVDYTILRNEVKGFRFKVPAGVGVEKVQSAHLEDWDLSRDGSLVVRLTEPVSGSHQVTLHLEQPLESVESQWAIPVVQVQGLERIKASVGLASEGGIEVEAVSQKESRPIDVRELPTELTSMNSAPLLQAYEYHKQPQEIVVRTRKGKEVPVLEATIDQAQGATLVTTDGKVCTAFTFELKNNRRQHMTVTLPEGAEIWSSFVDQNPVKPVKGENATIKIPLVSDGGTRTIPVRLVYVQQGLGRSWVGSQSYTAPKVDIPVSVVNWTLYLPDDREVVGLGGTMSEGQILANLVATAGLGDTTTGSSEKELVQSYFSADEPADNLGYAGGLARSKVSNKRMAQMLQETSRGAFPVEVQIPQSGQAFQFSQLLVTEETPTVVVRYYSGSLAVVLQILVVAGVFGLGWQYSCRKEGWRQLCLVLGGGLVLAGALPEGLFSKLCLWAVLTSVVLVGLWLRQELRRRHKERSREDAQV